MVVVTTTEVEDDALAVELPVLEAGVTAPNLEMAIAKSMSSSKRLLLKMMALK